MNETKDMSKRYTSRLPTNTTTQLTKDFKGFGEIGAKSLPCQQQMTYNQRLVTVAAARSATTCCNTSSISTMVCAALSALSM